jgi:23S rRNA (cytosine1962-C5)-methyltransferase
MNKVEYKNEFISSSNDYALIDFGDGEKLERFGKYLVSRPDPQALSVKRDKKIWGNADLVFERTSEKGTWNNKHSVPESWNIDFDDQKMIIKPTAFKHMGIFPEQQKNWQWMKGLIKNAGREISVLNLFAYTGGATLACLQVGAKVTHVDSSKVAVNWASQNALLSGLKDKPVRWIVEDVRKFVEREIKRESKYDAIIMDPPAFGHGANDELWKIEDDLISLIQKSGQLFTENPLFFLINGYSAGYSPTSYCNNLFDFMRKYGGSIEAGELGMVEDQPLGPTSRTNLEDQPRILPAGIYSRIAFNK